jgi:glutathione S-transferase
MQLYFSPLACSMATRIALYEVGAEASYHAVDLVAKTLEDGADFRAINPMGQVPTLRTDDGVVLTENGAVLQYVADAFPAAGLAPTSAVERARLHQWLSFIGTELHKGVFAALLSPLLVDAPEATRDYARGRLPQRLAVLEQHLTGREFLIDTYSVADAYLATVLVWTSATNVSLAPYPALRAYHARILARPAAARAFSEERDLYVASRPA